MCCFLCRCFHSVLPLGLGLDGPGRRRVGRKVVEVLKQPHLLRRLRLERLRRRAIEASPVLRLVAVARLLRLVIKALLLQWLR